MSFLERLWQNQETKEELVGRPNAKSRESEQEILNKAKSSSPEEQVLLANEKKSSKELNYDRVLFVELKDDGSGIFKPKEKERYGLRNNIESGTCYRRERAAYLVDRFLDFDLVPPTVIRKLDGQEGSMQQFVQDAKMPYQMDRGELLKNETTRDQLMKLWIFDYIVFNSDRHDANLLAKNDKIYAIDNELTFGDNYTKHYREFYDEELPKEALDKLENFAGWQNGLNLLKDLLLELLSEKEVEALFKRIENIRSMIKMGQGKIRSKDSKKLVFNPE